MHFILCICRILLLQLVADVVSVDGEELASFVCCRNLSKTCQPEYGRKTCVNLNLNNSMFEICES